MMGRIGAEVREKLGLAYHASSRVEGGHGPGPWSVNAGVNPANVQLATERIVDEIRRITTEPVSAEELADNQAYFTGHLPLQLENNDGIAGSLLNMETYDLGLDYLVNYRGEINKLTRDDLLQAVRHYWNADAFVLAVAGPDSVS
jgi:zinc protease